MDSIGQIKLIKITIRITTGFNFRQIWRSYYFHKKIISLLFSHEICQSTHKIPINMSKLFRVFLKLVLQFPKNNKDFHNKSGTLRNFS